MGRYWVTGVEMLGTQGPSAPAHVQRRSRRCALLAGSRRGLLLQGTWDRGHGTRGRLLRYLLLLPAELPEDCQQLFLAGQQSSGIFQVQPSGSQPFKVYCDMTAGNVLEMPCASQHSAWRPCRR